MKLNAVNVFIMIFALICGYSTQYFFHSRNWIGVGIGTAQYISVYALYESGRESSN